MILDETLFSPKIYHITGDIMWYEKDEALVILEQKEKKNERT